MVEATEMRDVIQAAAEGAAYGLAALRAAGIPAALERFAVEVDFEGGEAACPPGVAALMKVTFTVAEKEQHLLG